MPVTAEIVNRRGLHARASAALARLAGSLDAQVTLSKDGHTVNATSIMGLMMLGAARGDTVAIDAQGVGADAAIAEVAALIADRFGESE